MIEELVSVGSRGGPRGTIAGVYNYPDITLPSLVAPQCVDDQE